MSEQSSLEGPADGQGRNRNDMAPQQGRPGDGRDESALDDLGPEVLGGTPPPPRGRGCFKTLAMGCLTAVVLMSILGYVVIRNIRGISANLVRDRAVRMVKESELPEEQIQGLIHQVDRVASEFKRGNLTVEDVMRLADKVAEGPLFPLAMLAVAEDRYVEPSDLDEEEKRRASLALQRFARGVAEGCIPRQDIRSIVAKITWTTPEGEPRMMEQLSDEELRELLEEAEQAADDADISDEPYRPDIAAKAGQIVDRFFEETIP